MFIRKIGKFLRGKATPFQIISATVLGALLGSLPGLGQGPLLMALLLFLVIILNANLFLAGITLLIVKLLSLLLLPIYFNLGVILLDSPLGGLIAKLVNAPLTAWFGFEYYVMVPSLLGGLIFGLIVGIWMSRGLLSFRKKMADLETGSDRFQAYTSKAWVKVLAWLFVGGLKGKKSWSELSERKGGLPVRPLGIVFVLALMVLGYVGLSLMDRTIVTSMVRDALEKANGATVDIASVDIQAAESRIVLSGLAMADPEALETNRFSSSEIIADISGMDILSKKVVIDSIQVLEPATGTSRRLIGHRTVKVTEPEEVETSEGDISLDEYLGKAGVWRERFATVKRIYDRLAPYMKKDEDAVAGEVSEGFGWRERLAQRAREEGYASVKSDSLIQKSPRMWIRELKADNLIVGGSEDTYALLGLNISSQPALLEESGQLKITRMDGNLELTLNLPDAAMPSRSGVEVRYNKVSIPELEKQVGRDLPMEGGTMDIAGQGWIENAVLDLPLQVTLRDTTLNAFGSSLPMKEFPLEVRLHGPMESPRLAIPSGALQDAAKAAGKSKVEGLIKDKAGDQLKKLFPLGG